MNRTSRFAGVAVLGCCLLVGAEIVTAERQKTEGSKGLTVEGLGRGLKSAAQNVEKEIPKIGPAIGDAFKRVAGQESEKQSGQSPARKK